MKPLLILIISLFSLTGSLQADDLLSFSSTLNQVRYQSLVEELRCPKCLNQNLADSNAEIAIDLRNQVHNMIEAGKTDQEIIDYMVARYGQFVLYRPQNTGSTMLLWYGPFALLALGLLVFIGVIWRSRHKRANL
ncbi:cytochrome c-type biogenesis protein [Marinomonas sp. THO17]|uniref:cytochrome c-type biogenesis protein n=1 Tax=Marinomonas sp. THO17 TaxID=3149048 RepID=UPI00336C0B76